MSLRFSDTTITRLATMLKAATATISSRITAIIAFSIRIARKYAACSVVQSEAPVTRSADASAGVRVGASNGSAKKTRTPAAADGPASDATSSSDANASVASWSASPISNSPAVSNAPMRGASAPSAPARSNSRPTSVPRPACNWAASTRPSTACMLPGTSEDRSPAIIASPSGVPRPKSRASMPRSTAPASVGPLESRPCTSTKGSALTTPGSRRARSARRLSAVGSGAAGSVACADSASSRVRSSPSKPFMTERMAIRAATPSATPARDTQLMKETKYACCRART